MRISEENLRTPRQWRAALGCDAKHFDALVPHFTEAYAALNGCQLADKLVLTPHGTVFRTERDLLFFTLFSCKLGETYDVLGVIFGLDGATAKRRLDEGVAVLREALRRADCLPNRTLTSPAELQKYFSKKKAVLIDATEFATQRPQNQQAQKQQYSGKKKGTRSNHS
jgi:hypothetical protein